MSFSLAPGTVAGRYRLDRLLGKGGMGQVWAGTHQITRRAAALKFLSRATQLDGELQRRFLREARTASAVNHPNVVQIHDFFELEDGTPVMVMDLLEGETLAERLRREQSLSMKDAANVFLPVISAVGMAHALGIVHRDLKPENVFLVHLPGGGIDVKVLDFGIAKPMTAEIDGASSPGALTGTGAMLGTPSYMSPEQAVGDKDLDHRTDIWAIGVMLYEVLTGSRPIEGDNVGQIVASMMTHGITPIGLVVPDLPGDVTALIGKMLTRDRSSRPSSLLEVMHALAPHADVRVPAFGSPLSDRPSVPDAILAGERDPPRAVVRRSGAPDPEAPTDASSPEQREGHTPESDTRGPQSISVERGSRSRGAWLAAAAAVLGVGLLGTFVFRDRPASAPKAERSSGTAPLRPPLPPLERASPPVATGSTPAASLAAIPSSSNAEAPSTAAPPLAAKAERTFVRAARPTPHSSVIASAASSAPAPSAQPGGLIERLPF